MLMTAAGGINHAALRRPVRGVPLEIADELRPIGVAQELADREDLADVEPVVVGDALDRIPTVRFAPGGGSISDRAPAGSEPSQESAALVTSFQAARMS